MRWLIALFVFGSLVAALIAGLDGLLYVATLGTAAGTVGLAFATFRLSWLTQNTVEATREELKIAEAGVAAATRTADVAEHARIDSIAPVLNMTIELGGAAQGANRLRVPPNMPQGDALNQAEVNGTDFLAYLRLELINLGATPAYLEFTDTGGLTIETADTLIRIPVGGSITPRTTMSWTHGTDDNAAIPRAFQVRGKVRGPMTEKTIDWFTWAGVITLLQDFGGEGDRYQIPDDALRRIGYAIDRQYPGDPAPMPRPR